MIRNFGKGFTIHTLRCNLELGHRVLPYGESGEQVMRVTIMK